MISHEIILEQALRIHVRQGVTHHDVVYLHVQTLEPHLNKKSRTATVCNHT